MEKQKLKIIIKEMIESVLDEVSYWNPDEKDFGPEAEAWAASIKNLIFRKLGDPMLQPETKKTLMALKTELDKIREGALINLFLNVKSKKDKGIKVTPELILSSIRDKWSVSTPMNEGRK